MSIPWPTSPGPAPRKQPEPDPVRIRFPNGSGARLAPRQAAYMVLTAGAQVVDSLDPAQRRAYDEGMRHHMQTQEERHR